MPTTDATEAGPGPIALTIRHARTSRGETQEQLARRLSVRSMTVSNWERGVIGLTVGGERVLAQVAEAYGQTAAQLTKAYESAQKTGPKKKKINPKTKDLR